MAVWRLLQPIKVGPLELKNRILMPALELCYSLDGRVSQRHIDFYAERAAGGAALLIFGGCTIDRWAGGRQMISLKEDAAIEGVRRLTDGIHAGGALAGAQLYAAGAYSHALLSGEQAISCSAHVSAFTHEECRELTRDEIKIVVDDFATAARRAQAAGCDLVEICASAGYLIGQFLSPKINRRDDEFGGPLENRMRFGVEVCQAVRAALAPTTALSIRIAGHDFVAGSSDNETACTFAAAVAPHVDLINVTGGWHETRVPQLPAEVPPAAFAHLAAAVRAVVDKPVAASNRLGDPLLAEQVLRQGAADLICLGRPLIADPELPAKVGRNALDAIVPCTACNQVCFDHILRLEPVGCMVNPRAGREAELRALPTPHARRVLVVGGGVAGMTVAAVAAERGHQVTLCERAPQLGGQVVWAAEPTRKRGFPELLRAQERALRRAGVVVQCSVEVDVAWVAANQPEVVVIATGAQPTLPPIAGCDRPGVVQAWDVLRGAVEVGREVVVIGGGSVGCETALWLASDGALNAEQLAFLLFYDAEPLDRLRALQRHGWRRVTVVEMTNRLAQDLRSRRWIVVDALHKHGVHTLKGTSAIAIEQAGVRVRRPDQQETLLPCDSVVLATGARPDAPLAATLHERPGCEVHVVGDAAQVGKIPDAIAGAYELGCRL